MSFTLTITAGPDDIDELGHVNNAVWVRWIQDIAVAHWQEVAPPEQRDAFEDKGLLREMAEGWPLFAATLANMEMVLAKSDIEIAGHYAQLVEDERLREAIFTRIRDGWHQTHDGLLEITGQSRLLEKHPALDASIRLRLPYIEPLNLLQIELMKRHRAGEDDPRIGEGILLSINAVATALRNSG